MLHGPSGFRPDSIVTRPVHNDLLNEKEREGNLESNGS
jgi:hypothetical protein